MTELPVPEAAQRDPQSVEMLRVWIAEKSLWCSVKLGMYEDTNISEEKAWGTILADAARHLANACAQEYGSDRAKTLQLIRLAFLDELRDPTSETRGGFVRDNL